jgi:hypothetical protein
MKVVVFPVAIQHLLHEPLSTRRSAIEPGEICRGTSFINQDQPVIANNEADCTANSRRDVPLTETHEPPLSLPGSIQFTHFRGDV